MLLLGLLLIGFNPCLQENQTVIRTENDKCFHREGCPKVGKGRLTTVENAQNRGLVPCDVCEPLDHEHVEQGQNITCAGTTQAGEPCKRKPTSGSTYCWQHQARENGTRCEGITQLGKQCKRVQYDGRQYCNQHDPNAQREAGSSNLCQGLTKNGKRCKNKAKNGEFCYLHK